MTSFTWQSSASVSARGRRAARHAGTHGGIKDFVTGAACAEPYDVFVPGECHILVCDRYKGNRRRAAAACAGIEYAGSGHLHEHGLAAVVDRNLSASANLQKLLAIVTAVDRRRACTREGLRCIFETCKHLVANAVATVGQARQFLKATAQVRGDKLTRTGIERASPSGEHLRSHVLKQRSQPPAARLPVGSG